MTLMIRHPHKQIFQVVGGARFWIALVLLGLPGAIVFAASDLPPMPDLSCRAAVLMEPDSGSLLYEKNADEPIPPASMTKLVTTHVVMEEVRKGRFSLDAVVPVSRAADYRSLPRRSSLMFLETGQIVTVRELLLGLAIPSGNDAAIALAEFVSGSVDPFVELMNSEMRRLGLDQVEFFDASGLDERNRVTARQFAEFCRYYLNRHPEALDEFHNRLEFTYPEEHNLAPGASSSLGPITQYNHIPLMGRMDGVDGLKTGYIDESGYNVSLTAERSGMRLLAVILGNPGRNSREGDLYRTIDSTTLLNYGFFLYEKRSPTLEREVRARVYMGKDSEVLLEPSGFDALVLTRDQWSRAVWDIETAEDLRAPVERGAEAGVARLRIDGRIVGESPLTVSVAVPEGRWYQRLWGRLALIF